MVMVQATTHDVSKNKLNFDFSQERGEKIENSNRKSLCGLA
jgi:hypothetical protein